MLCPVCCLLGGQIPQAMIIFYCKHAEHLAQGGSLSVAPLNTTLTTTKNISFSFTCMYLDFFHSTNSYDRTVLVLVLVLTSLPLEPSANY